MLDIFWVDVLQKNFHLSPMYVEKVHTPMYVYLSKPVPQATKGEESNMVLMPCWNEEPDDTCIEQLVNALLNITDGMSETTDLRHYSQAVSNSISKPANAGSSSQEQPHWDRQGGGLRFGKLGRVSQVPSR